MTLRNPPIVQAQMLIRKPVAEVFEAFVDPAITTKFWFTKSSGKLEPGKVVQWDWEMYGVSGQVSVKAVEENKRILIEWDDRLVPSSGCLRLVRTTQRSSAFPIGVLAEVMMKW